MHAQRQQTFRADVQGLRAIAVLTVIAGHAGVSFLPGGFVGVDVFFVISGFLISQLLFREVERRGTLSIGDFYARRARRILPAATLVTVATLVASLLWLSVVDALDVVTDAVWATFFAANIRFSTVGTDYFAQEEGPSPLQHYWSLAVEEQFYLVWPLILLLCVVLIRRRSSQGARVERPPLPKLTVFWVLVVLGLASFAYGVYLTANDPTAAYFSTPARAWELAIGARHRSGRPTRRLADERPRARRGRRGRVCSRSPTRAGSTTPARRSPAGPPPFPSWGPRSCCWRAPGATSANPCRSGRCRYARCAWSATGPTRSTSGTGRC